MAKEKIYNKFDDVDAANVENTKAEEVKNRILDIINNKLTGGGNIDYLVGLAKVYRDLK